MSPFIREKKDFYAALFDGAGRLIVGSNLPVFGDVVGPIAEHYPLARPCGPATSTGSTTATPPREPCRIRPTRCSSPRCLPTASSAAFAQSWAHFNDIGGMRPGSLSPDCTEIFQEGHHRAAGAGGTRGRDRTRSCCGSSTATRAFPEMVKGDTRASMAAIRLGERRLGELFAALRPRADGRRLRAADRPRPSASCARSSRALVPRGQPRLHRYDRQRRPGPRAHQAALSPAT